MSTEPALVPATPSESPVMFMPKHVAAVVPFSHYERYEKLSFDQQKRLSHLLEIFAEMATASEGIVKASNRIGRTNPTRGCSGVNLRKLYYGFLDAEKTKKGTGWLTLAKIYRGPEKLPAEFVQEVRRRIENNAVSTRAAITELRTEWAEGKSIPGYGTWREFFAVTRPDEDTPERYPFNFFPAGWSESNLYEQQSSKAERAFKRRGWAAAKKYLPHVMRDLSYLRFMELIVIDDFETDQLVLAWNPETKRWQVCRCAGLLAIDAATRTKLAIGLKPRFTDDEGKKMSLTRADVQGLLHSVFSTWGLPTDYGCTILCENGGAAITDDFETALALILGVQVARTGLIHEKTLSNGFVQGGGKPWEKPWIESMFHLMHGVAGALPGQKGATYQLKPADLEAKVLYTEKLLNQDEISPEVAQQLRVAFLKVEEFLTAYERIFTRMEERVDHKLQGFEERFMFRLPDSATLVDKSSMALMAPETVLACTPLQIMESPRERRARLLEQCKRVPVAPHILACLLLTPKKVKLINHRLSFAHQSKGFTYADADSKVMKMPEGTELLGYFDPARPEVLHVMDLQGHYVGPVRSRNRVDIRDHQAIGNEQAEVSRLIHSCMVGPVNERHAVENAQLGADEAENIRLQLAAGVTLPVRMQPLKKGTGISTALAKAPAPARDVFAPGQQLASAISNHVGEADTVAQDRAKVRAQAKSLTAQDRADFLAPDQPAAPSVQPPSKGNADNLSDYI
jgi:hypothetical protein